MKLIYDRIGLNSAHLTFLKIHYQSGECIPFKCTIIIIIIIIIVKQILHILNLEGPILGL